MVMNKEHLFLSTEVVRVLEKVVALEKEIR